MKISCTAHALSARFADAGARGNLGALEFALTADDLSVIADGFARIPVQGARAPEALLERHDAGADLGTSSVGGHGKSPLPREQAR